MMQNKKTYYDIVQITKCILIVYQTSSKYIGTDFYLIYYCLNTYLLEQIIKQYLNFFSLRTDSLVQAIYTNTTI